MVNYPIVPYDLLNTSRSDSGSEGITFTHIIKEKLSKNVPFLDHVLDSVST